MPSSPEKKKLKLTAAASGVVCINTLPNKILHRILGFLPAHEAVQTCALSSRWRDVWKSMPYLRFIDPEDFPGPAEFNYFVNNLLLFRDRKPLGELVLWTYELPFREEPFPLYIQSETFRYLDMWIDYALMCEVRVLRVFVRDHVNFEPTKLANFPLLSQSLTTLELHSVGLDDDSLDFSGCPSLKVLEITDSGISPKGFLSTSLKRLQLRAVELHDGSLDFSRCPSLKVLEISASEVDAQSLSSQSLTHLHVCDCHFSSDTGFRIVAPNLFAIELDGIKGSTPFLESNGMPLLVTAYIRLDRECEDCCEENEYGNCGFDTCYACYGDPQGSETEKCVLLGGLSNVAHLKLKVPPGVSTFKRDLKYCPTFSKLKTLELDGWVEPLLCILRYAPVLEKLTIQLDKDLEYELNGETSCSSVEQSFPTEHLKIVEVKCGKVDGSALRFKKILIAYGISPEIINILGS